MNNEPILFVPCNLENTNMNSVQWFFLLQGECSILSNNKATWREVRCSQRSSPQSAVKHILRPCCKEDGQCTLTSPQHCWFMKGRVHLHFDHCTQVQRALLNTTTLPITYRSTLRRGCHHMRTIHDPVQYPVICTYKSNNRVVHTQKWINKK